jgi:hypothetical protein
VQPEKELSGRILGASLLDLQKGPQRKALGESRTQPRGQIFHFIESRRTPLVDPVAELRGSIARLAELLELVSQLFPGERKQIHEANLPETEKISRFSSGTDLLEASTSSTPQRWLGLDSSSCAPLNASARAQ